MAINDFITGLDIGSSHIRIVVGKKSEDEKKLNIIAACEVPSEGINKGIITSIDNAVGSITKCLEKAERVVGQPLEKVWVGISGNYIVSNDSKGVIAISRTDGEIQEDDVERVIEAARTVSLPANYDILHVIPRRFAIDGQTNIKDPIGMTGIRLEVDAQIIQALSSQVRNLTKCVYRTGVDIEDLVLSILAASQSVLTNKQKELGVAVINIGASTTSLIVFEDGDVIHTAILPVGSDHITADIAIGLRVSIDVAERIKLEYGRALAEGIDKKEELDLTEVSSLEEGSIPLKYISEIIEARVEEIFHKVDKQLKIIDRSGRLPVGAVLVGGGAKLPLIVEAAKRFLRLPVALGRPVEVASSTDKVLDISFMTAIGLVIWGNNLTQQRSSNNFSLMSIRGVSDFSIKIKRWLKNLVP